MPQQQIATDDEKRSTLDELQEARTALLERLDEIVGGNTLAAVEDGTLPGKLSLDALDDEDWDLVYLSGLIPNDVLMSEDKSAVLSALYAALYGILQCFVFFGVDVEDSWALDVHFFAFSEELGLLPLTEFAQFISREARDLGMPDEAIFALVGYMCDEDFGSLH